MTETAVSYAYTPLGIAAPLDITRGSSALAGDGGDVTAGTREARDRPRILIVEDDRGLRQAIRRTLMAQDYEVETAGDAYVASDRFGQFRPHLVVLDLMLPRGDGLELARRLRRRPGGNQIAIVILTARDGVAERLEGFEAGADDYVVKPVSMAELAARVKAQLRHVWSPVPEVLQFDDIRLDVARQTADRGGRVIELTSTEYHLLELFIRQAQTVLSRKTIGEQLWGVDFEAESNVIDVYVRRLRRKLEAQDERALIHTVRGSGYMMRAEPYDPAVP
jgi:two-component system, OmpR family, response regulator MprA